MEIREGTLPGGLPFLAFGDGPPVLVLAGLGAHHRNPTGLDRSVQVRTVRGPAKRFTVHLVQRRPGLAPGTTMADLADDVATAIHEQFGEAVPVLGTSTGGSIALQLVVDHPPLVSRLVLACAAARLGEDGRRRQRALAELTLAGEPRLAWAQLGPALAGGPVTRHLMSDLMWLTGSRADPDDPSDMVATIAAEDAFDVTDRLGEITAPTLVVASRHDGFYSPEIFERTARGIPDGHLLLYPRSSHMGVLTHRSAQRAMTAFLAGEEES